MLPQAKLTNRKKSEYYKDYHGIFLNQLNHTVTWPFHVITVVVENFTTSEVPGIVLMLVSSALNDLVVICDPLFIFCNGDVKKALKTFLKHHFPARFSTSS